MDNIYVKNPNYSPLDPASKRYITDTQAQGEAVKKSQTMTDMFAPFTQIKNDFMKGFAPENFYTPVPLKSNTPIAPKTQIPLTPTPLNPNYVAPKSQQGAGTPSTGGYVVKAGDTLGAIATRYGTTPQAIAKANGIADVNKIQVGQTLNLAGANQAGAVNIPTPQANTGAGVATDTGAVDAGATPASRLSPDELSNLAKLAGKAGLSIDAFMQLVQGNAASTGSEVDEIRNELGIPGLIDTAFDQPDKTTVDVYKELYDTAGLTDIKDKISKLDETINKKRADLVQATGELNSNPWISQGTRQGRLKNLQELAYADINNDIQARQQYLDLYDSGVSEIEKQISYVQGDREESRTLTVDKLNYLLGEAERIQTQNEQNTITEGLRNVPDFLQGVLDRESTEAARALEKTIANKAGSGVNLSIADVIAGGGEAVDIVRASAGGKQTTDSFRQGYEKTLNTLTQLSDLNEAFKTYKESGAGKGLFNTAEGELTGPIIGIIRSANPYDTKAQQIRAQLQAIVPNLARGVYGEVGVLTDQDIENYSKTLPNLKSTKEVRDALLAITAKSVYRALENKLLVQAKGGVDVSNFAIDLKQQRESVDALLSSVGLEPTGGSKAGDGYTEADVSYVESLDLP